MFKHYFLSLVGTTLTLLLAAAVFAWQVDPYGLYGEYTRADSNNKPEVNNQNRLHKRHQIDKNGYNALVLGSSRVHRAIDPNHDFFSGYKAYNLGMSGTNINEVLYSYLYAYQASPLDKILLVIDYNQQIDIETSENKPSTLIFKNQQRSIAENIIELRDTLLTITAVKDSLKTTFNRDEDYNTISTGGLYHIPKGSYREREYRRLESAYLAKLIDNDIATQLASRHELYQYYYKTLLAQLYQNNVATTILISPLHARFMEVIHAAGLWADYQHWKQILVTLNEQVAKQYSTQPFPVYDAAIYNSMSTERITKNKKAQWFYESSHAQPNYGTKILDEFASTKPPMYSAKLTGANISSHLRQQDILRAQYLQANADQVQHLYPEE